MDLSFFDSGHGPEVLLFSGCIREPGVSTGHLNIVVTQQLLETFQAHSGVEKLGSKRMAKTMDRMALLIESCLLEVFHKKASARTVTELPMAPAVKDELLGLVPAPEPEFEGEEGIIAQIDHPPHAVLLSFEEMNLSALDV
jgi:hypothetical protein